MIYDAVRTFNRVAIDFTELDSYIKQEEAIKILANKGVHAVHVKDGRIRPTAEVIIEAVEWALRHSHAFNYKCGARLKQSPVVRGQQSFVDCSSFIKWAYARGGIRIPRRSIQQRDLAGERINLEYLEPASLVFKTGANNYYDANPDDGVGHVGFYLGRNRVAHAVDQAPPIATTTLDEFVGNGHAFRGVTKIISNSARTYTFEFDRELEIEISDDIRWIILASPDLP